MNHKNFRGLYLGLILLVTAAALIAKKMGLLTWNGTTSHWWSLFLLIPVGIFSIRAVENWRQGERRRSRNMLRVALLIIPVFAAFLYPPLWKIIYIPFIIVIAVDLILWSIIGSSRPK